MSGISEKLKTGMSWNMGGLDLSSIIKRGKGIGVCTFVGWR